MLLAGGVDDPKGLQHRFEPFLRIGLAAGRSNFQHATGAKGDRFAVAIVSLSQHDCFKLGYRAVKYVVDENVTVVAVVLDFLAGFAEAAVELGFVDLALGEAEVAEPGAELFGVRRQNKDADGFRHGAANLLGALHVDIEDEVVALLACFFE